MAPTFIIFGVPPRTPDSKPLLVDMLRELPAEIWPRTTDLKFTKNLTAEGGDYEKWCRDMRRSKLESYEEILKALLNKPLIIDNLSYETNMSCAVLKQRLDFLIQNNLVEERRKNKRTQIVVTERGIAVSRALNLQKRLEKVRSAVMAIDDTLRIPPSSSEHKRRAELQS